MADMIRGLPLRDLELVADIISRDTEVLDLDLRLNHPSERREIRAALARRLRLARRVSRLIQLKRGF